MPYETAIPADFVPPQYRDEKFNEALERYSRRHRPGAQWVVAIPRGDLDPSSRVRYDMGSHVDYRLSAKADQVAVMHVIGVGRGRVRLGYREQIPVDVGDLVLINMREAGHWQVIEGLLTYWFTGEIAMVRMYRTDKPLTVPIGATADETRDLRTRWEDELFWNVKDVLNDYVVLARDPDAERYMQRGPETLLHIPASFQTDGTKSDDARDNRFPIVYRRVLGAGPGRTFRRESDLGLVEREETRPECQPGDMLTYPKTIRAATFTFQGMPLEVIHCATTMDIMHGNATALATGAEKTAVHPDVPTPCTWDVENELDQEEEDALKGLA
jgi:hypothetical protein